MYLNRLLTRRSVATYFCLIPYFNLVNIMRYGEILEEKEEEKGRVKNEEKLDGMRIKKFVPLTLKRFVL